MSKGYVGRPMEILLIEDGRIDARVAIEALRRVPFRTRLALVRDGDEASQYLHRTGIFAQVPPPDIILLDLVLPNRDGLTLLAEIHAEPALAKIPVVVLTASDSPNDRTLCANFHVTHFIRKPVNLHKFLNAIEDLEEHWHQDIVLPFEKGKPDP